MHRVWMGVGGRIESRHAVVDGGLPACEGSPGTENWSPSWWIRNASP